MSTGEASNASEASANVGTELQFGPLDRPVRLTRPRLQSFDYRGPHVYHVIVVVKDRTSVFEDLALGRWCLSALEEAAIDTRFALLAFCLMPDHLHVLAQGNDDSSHLVTFLQRFKQRTGFRFKQEQGRQLWQDSYYERVLRKEEDLQDAAAYVFHNPVAEGLCEHPEDYALSGGTYAVATLGGPN